MSFLRGISGLRKDRRANPAFFSTVGLCFNAISDSFLLFVVDSDSFSLMAIEEISEARFGPVASLRSGSTGWPFLGLLISCTIGFDTLAGACLVLLGAAGCAALLGGGFTAAAFRSGAGALASIFFLGVAFACSNLAVFPGAFFVSLGLAVLLARTATDLAATLLAAGFFAEALRVGLLAACFDCAWEAAFDFDAVFDASFATLGIPPHNVDTAFAQTGV